MSLCLFNLYAEYIKQNAGLDEAQAGINIAGRNINNLWNADDTTLMAESKEELKSHLMTKMMSSGSIHLGLDKAQAGIKIASRNINNLRYADDTTLMAESEK